MAYVTQLPSGSWQINTVATFCGVLNNSLPDPEDELVGDIIERFDAAIRAENPAVNPNALNNAHGSWYEWLLGIAAWNTHVKHGTPCVAFPLPNVRQFDCARLYIPKLYDMVRHLREEVVRSAQVQLISSNPDFVIVESDARGLHLPRPITHIDVDLVTKIDTAYQHFVGQCEFGKIRGYAAAKTSFRPDRRLQIPHEGSLMKALYVHLQTRQWITNPPELKFYAITSNPGESDRNALRTVATHSITTVSSKPQSAVDEVFKVNTMSQAEAVFLQILNP